MQAEPSSIRRRIIGSRSTTSAVGHWAKNIAKYLDVGRNIDRYKYYVQEIKYFQLFYPKKWRQISLRIFYLMCLSRKVFNIHDLSFSPYLQQVAELCCEFSLLVMN